MSAMAGVAGTAGKSCCAGDLSGSDREAMAIGRNAKNTPKNTDWNCVSILQVKHGDQQKTYVKI